MGLLVGSLVASAEIAVAVTPVTIMPNMVGAARLRLTPPASPGWRVA
jgi:hypothetical protein